MVYALLYVSRMYDDIFISTYLGYQIRAYIHLFVIFCFFITH